MVDVVLNYAIRFWISWDITNIQIEFSFYFNLHEQFCVERGTIFHIIYMFDFKESQTNNVGRDVPTDLFNERSAEQNDVIIASTIAFEQGTRLQQTLWSYKN